MSQLKNAAFPQLVVKGSNSRGLTTAPFKSNVDRLINSWRSTCWAGSQLIESLSLFCCSCLWTRFLWRFRFLLDGKVLLHSWQGRFSWSFLCWSSNLLFTKVFGFFSHTPSTHIQPCWHLTWLHFRKGIFIGPESDHCLPLSLTDWLTD